MNMNLKIALAALILMSTPVFGRQVEPEWYFLDFLPRVQKLTPKQRKMVEDKFNEHFKQFDYYLGRVNNTAQLIPKCNLKVLALEAVSAAALGASGMNPTKRVFAALVAVTAHLAKTTWDQYNEFCELEKTTQYHYQQALWYYNILKNDEKS